jgi:pimeloyl-ACP methyl ester carboxylesterase/DNA-binding CsgD family transcriptional regulator
MAAPAQRIQFCTSRDGVRIAYAVSGSGPPLLRTPNQYCHLRYDWDSSIWRHWLALLASRYTLIRYDLRGCGLSDREGVEFSFDRYLEDMEAVAEAAGLQRFAICGWSGGGATGVAYAACHPDQVSHLVLHGCYSRARLARNPTQNQIDETELQLKAIELGLDFDNPALRQLYASIRMPDSHPDQLRSFDETVRLATTPVNASKVLRSYFKVDLTDLAPKVKCPTLISHARQDAAIPFDEGRALAALIPGARFVPLESRNHYLVEGEPAWLQLVEELEEFLPAVPARKSDAVKGLLDELTGRENEVLELVARGLDNDTIGTRLGISERTVRNNVSIIFGKLGVSSRAQAIVRARDAGYGKASD